MRKTNTVWSVIKGPGMTNMKQLTYENLLPNV